MEQINIFDWANAKQVNIGDVVKANYGWHLEGVIPIRNMIQGTVVGIDDNNYTVEFVKDGVKKVTGIYKALVKKVL